MSGTRNSRRVAACVLKNEQAGWGHRLLSAVSVLVDALPNSEIPKGLTKLPYIYSVFEELSWRCGNKEEISQFQAMEAHRVVRG
jgi:hypothetical protein